MSEAAIQFDDVSVDLGGVRILDGVGFDVAQNGFTALVGPNGSGKTTLVRTLYRSLTPAHGTIRVAGRALADYTQTQLAKTLAVLRQEPPMSFEFLVEELVLTGRSPYKRWLDPDGPDDREAVEEALAMTETTAFRRRPFDTLSGGEKQRVLLARALAQRPTILVLDEPTNHLDIRHRLEILSCVKGLGITVLAALHDLALADRFATDVVMLDRGRVHVHGAPKDVLSSDHIRSVFGVRAHRGSADDLTFERIDGAEP